jgi:hypothetical protein
MEFKPFYHEAQIALSDDFTLHMVVDISVVERLEGMLGRSMDQIIEEMFSSASMLAKVLWGVTRPNHDDLTMAQIAGILLPADPAKVDLAHAVATTVGDLVRRSFLVVAELKQKPRRKRS